MGKFIYKVKEGHGSLRIMLDAVDDYLNFDFPKRMTSYKSRVNRFLQKYPEYNVVPRSILRGANDFGDAISDDTSGFRQKNGHLWVRRLEDIYFTEPLKVYGLKRVQLTRKNGGEIIFHASAKKHTRANINPKETKFDVSNVQQYKQNDNVLDFLDVNNEWDGNSDATWRKYAILKFIEDHPYLTRQELEEMGVISNKDWDLLVDFHPGMQEWNRANPKPKDPQYKKYKVLSLGPSGQYAKRLKNEKRMPDVIDDEDSDKGNLKGQAFDGEVQRALRNARWDFLS